MYRLLEKGDILRSGDEWYNLSDGSWNKVIKETFGCKIPYARIMSPHRRKISQIKERNDSVAYQLIYDTYYNSKVVLNTDLRTRMAEYLKDTPQPCGETNKSSPKSCTNCGSPTCGMKAGFCGDWEPCKTSGN